MNSAKTIGKDGLIENKVRITAIIKGNDLISVDKLVITQRKLPNYAPNSAISKSFTG